MNYNKALRQTYNHIIDKDEDFGTVKPARYQLPDPDFTYGKPPCSDKEGAKEVISSWKRHNPTRPFPTQKNFRTLNKISADVGLTTAKGFRTFTKLNKHMTITPKVGTRVVQLSLPEEDFAFGVPNRPSTPMKAVMSNEYGNNEATKTRDMYRDRIIETLQPTKLRPRTTKAVEVAAISNAKKLHDMNDFGTSELFKLKKFQSPKAKVDTINTNYIPPNRNRPQTAQSTSSLPLRPQLSQGKLVQFK